MRFRFSLFLGHLAMARARPHLKVSGLGDEYTAVYPTSGNNIHLENPEASTLLLDDSNVVANNPFPISNYPNSDTEGYQFISHVDGGSEPSNDITGNYGMEASDHPDFVVAALEQPKCDSGHTHPLCCDDKLSSAAQDRTHCTPCRLFLSNLYSLNH